MVTAFGNFKKLVEDDADTGAEHVKVEKILKFFEIAFLTPSELHARFFGQNTWNSCDHVVQ